MHNKSLTTIILLIATLLFTGLCSGDELEERRASAQVLPALMNSTNFYWNGTSLNIEFEVLTYSPKEDLSFGVYLYDHNLEGKKGYNVPDSYVSNSGFGRFVLYSGGVRQNKLKINFTVNLDADTADALKPVMYVRAFICNNNIQDKLGTIDGYNWPGRTFTLYIPKIINTNMNDTNDPYDKPNQDYAQRYIKVTANSCVNTVATQCSLPTESDSDPQNPPASELEERRAAAKVLPPLMTSTDFYWKNENSIFHIEFEVLTYSPKDDLSFQVNLYDSDLGVIKRININNSMLSYAGYGAFRLHTGGVKQNIIKVSLDGNESELRPTMYARVFICNNNIQDELGTINDFNWPDAHFTLYVPKIIEKNMHFSNSLYDKLDQDYAQRYIKIAGLPYNGDWDVPYLSQLDYPNNMRESACGPTSVTMLLSFYYPYSDIDMPEVYHAGVQTYNFNSGPAHSYRNVSFAKGVSGTDSKLSPLLSRNLFGHDMGGYGKLLKYDMGDQNKKTIHQRQNLRRD